MVQPLDNFQSPLDFHGHGFGPCVKRPLDQGKIMRSKLIEAGGQVAHQLLV